MPGTTILVADDDRTIRTNLSRLFQSEGYGVLEAANGREVEALLASHAISLVLLDLIMPERSGLEVLRGGREQFELIPVIVITALGGSAAAIEAMKLGAYDYITKPFDLDDVLYSVQRALARQALLAESPAAELASVLPTHEEELIGRTPAMLEVFKVIGRVAATQEPVLILGESGTGKELVANAIQSNSTRTGEPFVKVNCAALSPLLLESELFGHEKGAFTGAVSRRLGRFEQADNGTLFLDEIGDLNLHLQAKLLRVLQSGTFERVGGSETIKANVRVLSATNRALANRVAEQQFREDLFYRLNVVVVQLPPLRQRREDIPLLADHVLQRLAAKYHWPKLALSPTSLDLLVRYPWPGNVRELQNVLVRAAIHARGRLILPEELAEAGLPIASIAPLAPASSFPSLREILAETERQAIGKALEKAGWNRTQAARQLGISRRQLFDKIRLYGLKN